MTNLVRSPGEVVGQATVRGKLGGHVRAAIPPACPLHRDDVRVRDHGPHFGAMPQLLLPLLARAQAGREYFYSDGLLEWPVQGAIDGARRTAANLVDDLVVVSRGQPCQTLAWA